VGITLDGCECWGGLGAGQLGASSACCWQLAACCCLCWIANLASAPSAGPADLLQPDTMLTVRAACPSCIRSRGQCHQHSHLLGRLRL
jgi:hypothetical protein